MNKPSFKLGFTDTFKELAVPFFMDLLSTRYNVERDDENPQILIFGDENFGMNNVNYDPSKVLKIFFTGENRRFWNYQCHMGITYDHIDSNIHYRLPLYVYELYSLEHQQGFKGWEYESTKEPTPKDGFCSFVVSNGTCPERNNFFHKLNSYKKVDSAGPHLNNIGYVIPRPTGDKIEFAKTRKFHMCYENGSHPGYVTEKILHAFYARSVPIYWGSTTLEIDFNPEAVLNWHDYKDDDKFMKRIIEVDNNDELYYHMLNQPMFRNNKPNSSVNPEMFLDWFDSSIIRRFSA